MSINSRDVSSAITGMIEDAIHDAVEKAIDNVDMDDKISEAISNYDFSDVISEDTVKDNVDIREIVSDVAGDIISDSVNKLRNELLEYVSGLVADHSMLLNFEDRLLALECPKNVTSSTRLWDRIRMWLMWPKR